MVEKNIIYISHTYLRVHCMQFTRHDSFYTFMAILHKAACISCSRRTSSQATLTHTGTLHTVGKYNTILNW